MLKYRILTATVLLLIIFSMIWLLKSPWFGIWIAVFFLLSAYEWGGLVGLKPQICYSYVLCVAFSLYLAYFLSPLYLLTLALVLWLWAAAAIYTYQIHRGVLGFQIFWIKTICGVIMLAACWKASVLLQSASPWWLLMSYCICWLSDTGAFFAGRRWGKRALADKISPKKTWEGFWGGVVLTVFVINLVALALHMALWQRILLIPMVTISALFAVVGDLFVSLLKRQAGLKDSGRLLPGHGGILDRVDSSISSVPIFALGFLLLKL